MVGVEEDEVSKVNRVDWDFARVDRIDVDFKARKITGWHYKDQPANQGFMVYNPYQEHIDWTKKLVTEKVLPSLKAHMKISGEDLLDCMACVLEDVADSLYEDE